MRSKFKDEHPFEKRKAEAERIRQKYSDRIPVSILPSSDRLFTAVVRLVRGSLSSPQPSRFEQSAVGLTVHRPIGNLREGREERYRYYRQEEVPCPRRSHRRPVRLRDPQADQALTREGHLHFRR